MNMADGIACDHAEPAAAAADGWLAADAVSAMARAAGLPLAAGRESALLPILDAWLRDSASLNALMQGDEHRETLPITLFVQGAR